ncbi:MAG: MATE family efflux transporter, partial [Acidimicrobiales bacterium]
MPNGSLGGWGSPDPPVCTVGISIAASTLVGRYVGAEDRPAAERSFRSSLLLGAILGGVVAVLF